MPKPNHSPLPPTTKYCRKCDQALPAEKFGKSYRAKSGLQTYCMDCLSVANRMYRINNTEKRREQEQRSRKKHAASTAHNYIRCRARKKNIPISPPEIFKEWYEAEKKQCEYCHTTEEKAIIDYGHKLHVERKIPSIGYIVGNLVLSCQRCNFTKNSYLTHEQMKEIAARYFIPKAKGESDV